MIFRLLVSLLSNICSPFHFLWGPIGKKMLHFCQQKWKRNVNFRGRGNSQAQTRSWSLHNVVWLIFLCHPSAPTEVKNGQLKQWWRSCGAPAVRKGLVLNEGGAAACVWHRSCHVTDPALGLPSGNVLFGTLPSASAPWNALSDTTAGFGLHAEQGSSLIICICFLGGFSLPKERIREVKPSESVAISR